MKNNNTTAHVIIIGDEILYGHTLDTNSHYLAKEFGKLSIDLIQISAIQDNKEDIKTAILSSMADVIITTGGLGPTRDDKTKYVLSELLGQPLEMNAQALAWTEDYFQRVIDRPMNVLNKNQALVPEGTIPLHNKVGTAPGLWSNFGQKLLINLPGVPTEMKYLMQHEVMPRLMDKFHPQYIRHQFITILNIPESELAKMLHTFENQLPKNISLAYLPRGKKIQLRLTAFGKNAEVLLQQLNTETQKMLSIVPEENFVGINLNAVERKVGKLLKEKHLTLCTAESFTSGKIAASMTKVPGSSAYFKGGIVAYSTEVKKALLQVPEEVIAQNGLANKDVALHMAKGALLALETDVAVSSTGVAGPDPDDFGVEPGIAFVAIVSKDKEQVFEAHFPKLSRKDFTKKLTDLAMQKLYLFLREMD